MIQGHYSIRQTMETIRQTMAPRRSVKNRILLPIAFMLILPVCLVCGGAGFSPASAQNAPLPAKEVAATPQADSAYRDLTHYSKVFGHDKYYRLYLPDSYAQSSRRYPVIYFFHGWGGRHFKDDNALLEYVKLKDLVNKYQAILVMWDGNIDLSEPRPYNVGNHEDIKFEVQMKDYFPELVGHIDSSLRTLTDRGHRGIIGFSMGGFMSLFLAGKYPDKICAAVSLAGSPEFFVGTPDNQELYPVRYTFENLRQVDTRIHNGNSDILYDLNSEVHAGALWDEKVRLQYWVFQGGHMIDKRGETKVFGKAMEFITDAFNRQSVLPGDPLSIARYISPAGASLSLPAAPWSHYDLYPDFSVWDYKVNSDKQEPGFLYLKNVDAKGFGFYTRRWLPLGPALPDIQATITTAPRYAANKTYGLARYSVITNAVTMDSTISDSAGRISVKWGGAGGEMGIFTNEDAPGFVFLDYKTNDPAPENDRSGSPAPADALPNQYARSSYTPAHEARPHFLTVAANSRLTIRLFNRGGEVKAPSDLRIRLSTADPSVRIKDSVVTVRIFPGDRIVTLPPLALSCNKKPTSHAEPAEIRFHLAIGSVTDEFIVPVFFRAPLFDSIRVDDGQKIRDSILGEGNGNGITEAGERILLYQGTHRLRLYTDDPWVLPAEERLADEMIPARWPDGFTFSSVVQVAPDCPDGHVIEFLTHYETKAFNPIERKLSWGRVKLIVRNHAVAKRISMDEFFGVNVGGCSALPADVRPIASWIRDYSQWQWLQPEKDHYTFTDAAGKMNYDAYYRGLDSQGIRSLFVVQQTPTWLSSNKTATDAHTYAPSGTETGLKPEHYKEAASFFYQLAARYGHRQAPADSLLTRDRLTGLRLMDALEVFNEPDGNWGNHVSLQQYAALLNAAYDGNGGKMKGAYGVKAADSNMLVSIGGLADNLGSLKKIVAYAGRAPFDIINAHYYTFQNLRESFRISVAPEWSSLVPDMQEMVKWSRLHAPGRPVWMTEIGWDTKDHSTEYVSQQEAANYLIRSYLLVLGTGIEKCFWFIYSDIDDGPEKPGVFTSSGLFENGSTPWSGPTKLKPKLTYWYDATCKSLLSGYYFDKKVSVPGEDSTIYDYRFLSADGKKQLAVLWYCPHFQFAFRPLSGQPSHISYRYALPGQGWTVKKVVRPVAGSFDGSPQPFQPGNGTISLTLDATPVFVELEKTDR